MAQWEYKVIVHKLLTKVPDENFSADIERTSFLNVYGAEGWELVSVLNQNYRRESDPTALFGYTIASYFLKRQAHLKQASREHRKRCLKARMDGRACPGCPVARRGPPRAAKPERGRHDFLVGDKPAAARPADCPVARRARVRIASFPFIDRSAGLSTVDYREPSAGGSGVRSGSL